MPVAESDISGPREQKVYAAIGRFIFEYSQLEFTLKHYLADLLDTPDRHFSAAMSGYDFAYLCRLCERVFRDAVPTQRDAIQKLISKAQRLNDERVKVVHGLWMVHGDETGVSHVSRNKLEPQLYFDKLDDLTKLANEARDIRSAITSIVLDVPFKRPE